MTDGQIKKRLTFILHELTPIIALPERFEDRLLRVCVVLPDEPLQTLCCFFAVVSTISVSTGAPPPIVGDSQKGILGKN